MKRFIFAVVLLSIVCTLLNDEVMGSSVRNKRAMKKPGLCPKPFGPGECFELCKTDEDCPGKFKCCFDGCGRLCMSPGH
ncbi:omwaprin-a-like isoform X1 [Oculina patagonica]